MNYDWNKTVSITVPAGLNGWVTSGSVTINGVKVTFPVGKPTTVPEPVAAMLNAMIAEADPDTSNPFHEPFMQYVTDADGNPVWAPRECYKYTTTGEVVNLAETELTNGSVEEDATLFAVTTPFAAGLADMGIYDVTYNGVVYQSKAMDMGLAFDGVANGVFALGNLAKIGADIADSGEPFVLTTATEERAWMLVAFDGATSVTLSVTSVVETKDVKTLDPELLPPEALRKKITLTIADDGTVTSDTDFDTAWAMDAAELQAAINIVSDVVYFGHVAGECTPLHVLKVENTFGDTTVKGIQMRYVTPFTDISDTSYRSEASFLFWVSTDGEVSIGKETPRCPGLPLSNALTAGMYMRYNGSHWDGVTLDQLKADLGLA